MAGTNFREGAIDAVRNTFCTFADDVSNFGRWFYQQTAPAFLPRYEQLPDLPLVGGGLAGLVCPNLPSSPLPPAESVPFTGGQCVGTQYNITVSVIRNGIPTDFTDTRIGPIGTPVYELDGNAWRGRWYRPDGSSVLWSFDSISTGFEQPEITSFQINSVVSGPDDCGDLPPEPAGPPDPGSNVFSPDIEYDPGTGPVIIPTNLVFAFPVINITGELTIPFDLSGAEFALQGELNVSTGDINFNFGGGNSASDACCLADIIEDILPDLPGDDPPENEKFTPRIVAVMVTTISVADNIKASEIGQQNAPNFYHPRLGNISFNLGRTTKKVWTEDIPVRRSPQLIVCPVDYGAAEVVGDPANGVSWTLRPLRRRVIETDFPD